MVASFFWWLSGRCEFRYRKEICVLRTLVPRHRCKQRSLQPLNGDFGSCGYLGGVWASGTGEAYLFDHEDSRGRVSVFAKFG